MKGGKFITFIALLICLAVLFFSWRHSFSPPAADFRPSAAAGEVLADEVGRLPGGKGEVVIVMVGTQGPAPKMNNAHEECLASFTETLQHQGTVKPGAIVVIPPPSSPLMLNWVGLTPERFLDAMDKDSNANALVVFTALPPYSPVLAKRLKARSMTLVVVSGYDSNMRRWIESKALTLALVPRLENPASNSPTPKTVRELFESEYQLITPENVANIPY